MNGIERIAAERKRQIEVEGWSLERDGRYRASELAFAASSYALPPSARNLFPSARAVPLFWPWADEWWKPGGSSIGGRVRDLEKSGALIAAEIDRLLGTAGGDRKSTRLNSSHIQKSRMPSSA